MSHFNLLLLNVYRVLKKSIYTSTYEKLKPAIEFIEQNFDQNFSIKDLTLLCNYSEPRFFTHFKEVTGVTPIAYKHNTAVQNMR